MRLKSLTLRDFRSWFDEHTFEFPSTGVLGIRSHQSGSGKSSIFWGIADALGYCPISVGALHAFGRTRMVRLDIVDGPGWETLSITRDGPQAILTIDGVEVVRGPAKDVDPRLHAALGVASGEWIERLTHKEQDAKLWLLEASDAQIKDFFAELTNSQAFGSAEVKAAAENAKLVTEKARLEAQVQALQSKILALASVLAPAEEPAAPVDLRALEKEMSHCAMSMHGVLAFASPEVVAKATQVANDLAQGRTQHETARAALLKAVEAQAKADKRQTAIADLEAQIKQAEKANADSKCFTCKQTLPVTLPTQHLRDALAKIQAEPRPTEVDVATARKAVDSWGEAVSVMTAALRKAEADVEAAKTLAQKQGQAEWRVKYEAAQVAYNTAVAQNQAHAAWVAGRQAYDKAQADIAKYTAEIATAQAAILPLNEKIKTTEWAALVLGPKGAIGYLLEDTLESIQGKAERTLARLPNTANISLSLSTEKATKSSVQRKVTLALSNQGNPLPARWRPSLSGGQATSVEIALFLACAEHIQDMLAAKFDWLLLDEPFTYLSPQEIEQAVEDIKQIAQDRLVIIIEHSPFVKEALDEVWDITYENGSSRRQ